MYLDLTSLVRHPFCAKTRRAYHEFTSSRPYAPTPKSSLASMPLIHRFNGSDEHAQMLTTSHTRMDTGWPDALYPTIQDLQAVFRRLRTDPELTQDSVFRFYAPIFIFVCLFGACAVSLRLGMTPMPFSKLESQLAFAAGLLILGVLALLLLFRTVIWAVAFAVQVFVETDWKKRGKEESIMQLNSRSILFGGMFS
ncbi:hypothetical protein PAXINDRAFT_156896 [Paxillus involutus ATCC 200175]|uniref:Uncharacterized protein n=1 Tax=Paxillus involutus ATCC 200175 TaxID=664439 RepID=A0A0C9SU87_PAXIN|nr:hypothetical protein PAXINDRAFT_156896 [Paxillus involutus ATCC 200175]